MATGTIPSGRILYFGPNAATYQQALITSQTQSCSVLWKEGSYYCIELSSPKRRLYIAQNNVNNVSGTVTSFTPSNITRYITSENYEFYLGPGTTYSEATTRIDFPFEVTYVGKKENNYALIEYTPAGYSRKYRAWFYASALSSSSRSPENYTNGHQINYEGDKWSITNGWASSSVCPGHLGVDVKRLSSSGYLLEYKNVYAAAAGTVIQAQASGGANGNCVIIEHDLSNNRHYYSTYCHLDGITVNANEEVEAGQVIGVMGKTGNTDIVHVHIHITKTNAGLRAYGYNRDPNDNYLAFAASNFKDISNGLNIRYFNPEKFFTNGSQFISQYYDADGTSG